MDTSDFWQNGDMLWELAISFLMVITAIIVGRWLVVFLVDKGIRVLVKRSRTSLDDVVVDAFRTPLYM